MAGRTANTAIRLGIGGDAEVKRALEQIGETGDAAAQRIAKSFVRAEAEVEAAMARREREVAKLKALAPGLSPEKLDAYAGVNEGGVGRAATSGAVFGAYFAEMERRAEALRRALDPLYAAQQRYNSSVAEARTLVSAGVMTLDDYAMVLRQSGAELDRVRAANGRAGAATGQMRQAMAGASYQVQDFVTQISMGANPINAFVVQGGQLAGTFMHVEGRAGAVARFLMGGWGLALQMGLMVLAPFVAKLSEGGKAAEEARKATEEHRKAILALADAQEKAIQTAERKQSLDAAQIKIELDAALAVRQRVQAELEAARVRMVEARQRAGDPTLAGEGGFNPGAVAAAGYDRAMTELTSVMQENAATITRLQGGFDAAFARMMQMRADAASTPEGRIRAKYDDLAAAAMRELGGTANGTALYDRLRQINDARDRELKAIERSTQARDQETLTANQVAKMLRGELPGVQVTSTTGGRHVKNSYHYRNQAIDFVPAGGMGSMTKEDVRRIFESRGIEIVELLGPGDKGHSDHFHVAWTKGKLSLDAFTDAAKRAKEEAEQLANLRVFTSGDAVMRNFAQVLQSRERAAREYAEKVRELVGPGDLLGADLDRANSEQRREWDAWNREQARRTDQQRSDLQGLAGMYQTLFTGGAKGVWQSFRQLGLQVLSELLARWTLFGTLKGPGGEGVSSGLFGTIGRLFGGGGATPAAIRLDQYSGMSASAALGAFSAPAFAVGTPYFSGGAALVGELGPELVTLPRGSRIDTARETRRILANDNVREGDRHFHFTGNLMTSDFWAQIQAGDDMAATRGAYGGAAIGGAEQQSRAARRLGRNWR